MSESCKSCGTMLGIEWYQLSEGDGPYCQSCYETSEHYRRGNAAWEAQLERQRHEGALATFSNPEAPNLLATATFDDVKREAEKLIGRSVQLKNPLLEMIPRRPPQPSAFILAMQAEVNAMAQAYGVALDLALGDDGRYERVNAAMCFRCGADGRTSQLSKVTPVHGPAMHLCGDCAGSGQREPELPERIQKAKREAREELDRAAPKRFEHPWDSETATSGWEGR